MSIIKRKFSLDESGSDLKNTISTSYQNDAAIAHSIDRDTISGDEKNVLQMQGNHQNERR